MLFKNDPCKILNIKSDTSKSEIRKAYRRLAMEWHPDKNPDNPYAEKRFREIQQAYEILLKEKTNPDQDIKNQYDNDFISSVHDHPFQSLRETIVKYYTDRGWFKNKP